MHMSMKFQEIVTEKGIFDLWPLLMMMHVSTKIHEILKEKAYLNFDLC